MAAELSRSQNGWPASPDPSAIGITAVKVPVKNGTATVEVARAVAPIFEHLVKWFDDNIEPVKPGLTFGYNYRPIRGYEDRGVLSNHSSGTAIDINSTDHWLGEVGTFTPEKAAMLSAKAKALGLRWGGDYTGRKDEMHFEVDFSPNDKTAIANRAGFSYGTSNALPWVFAGVITLAIGGTVWYYRDELREKLRPNG